MGLGRVELPTSPLSGVRSSHLSYRPALRTASCGSDAGKAQPPVAPGGADRNRTDGLLSANQALSQLSYSP